MSILPSFSAITILRLENLLSLMSLLDASNCQVPVRSGLVSSCTAATPENRTTVQQTTHLRMAPPSIQLYPTGTGFGSCVAAPCAIRCLDFLTQAATVPGLAYLPISAWQDILSPICPCSVT